MLKVLLLTVAFLLGANHVQAQNIAAEPQKHATILMPGMKFFAKQRCVGHPEDGVELDVLSVSDRNGLKGTMKVGMKCFGKASFSDGFFVGGFTIDGSNITIVYSGATAQYGGTMNGVWVTADDGTHVIVVGRTEHQGMGIYPFVSGGLTFREISK